MTKSKYEGKQDELKAMVIEPALEIFHNVYREQDFGVRHVMDEFNSICPKTGLPDFDIAGGTQPATAGVSFEILVNAVDEYWNINTGDNPIVTPSSQDDNFDVEPSTRQLVIGTTSNEVVV